jgi:predicted NBD/HSP70 family sugar kinase
MTAGIGLDIGATKTLGVVVDEHGAIRASVRRPTVLGADGVLATAAEVVEALRREVGEAAGGAVGVGVPGLVDTDAGAVKHAVNLGVDGDWLPVGRLLAELVGVPVLVENDVNAATLGAVAHSGADDLVYLSIGTGLAAGLVLDGRLRRGDHGAAGEIGHVPVDPSGQLCSCGQRGCLETVASGSALAAAWPSDDQPAAQAVFAAATAGNREAAAIRDRFADGVAEAIRVLSLSVDPRTVVLGGGVAQLGQPLLTSVTEALGRQSAGSPFLASLDLAGRLRLVPADHPVAAVGAALLGRSSEPVG